MLPSIAYFDFPHTHTGLFPTVLLREVGGLDVFSYLWGKFLPYETFLAL